VPLGTYHASVRWWLKLADRLLVSPSEATAATHHQDPWTLATAQAVVLGLHGYSLASHPLGALHVDIGHIVCVRREASSKVRVMDSQVDLDHMHHLLGTSQCWR